MLVTHPPSTCRRHFRSSKMILVRITAQRAGSWSRLKIMFTDQNKTKQKRKVNPFNVQVHFLWFIISLVALTFLIAVTDFLCLAALSESGASLLPFALSTPQISVIHPVDFPAFLGISSGFAMGRLGRRSSESRFGAKSYKLASSSLLCEGWSRWSAQNVRLEKKSKFQEFF